METAIGLCKRCADKEKLPFLYHISIAGICNSCGTDGRIVTYFMSSKEYIRLTKRKADKKPYVLGLHARTAGRGRLMAKQIAEELEAKGIKVVKICIIRPPIVAGFKTYVKDTWFNSWWNRRGK